MHPFLDHSAMDNRGALHDSPSTPVKELDKFEDYSISEVERIAIEGSVWRKFDRYILPLCTMFYLLFFLDRSNIGNARVAGLQTSLRMTDYQYSIALTVTYIPYMVADLPSNLLLKYVGPNLMLPTMTILWGLVATLQGCVNNYSGLLACRFFLGLVEGGLYSVIVLYLSLFYPRKRLQIRVATFFASASLSGAFSGLLAAAIDEINGEGGRPGWAWIFILEGIFTVLFGIIAFFVLPSSPGQARFLSQKELTYVMAKLREDGAVSRDEEKDRFRWTDVIEAARSPHVILASIAFFFNGATLFGLAYFGPTIVVSLGYAGNRAQLMSVPPFAAASFCSLVSSVIADRYRCRGLTVIFFCLLEIAGFSLFYASESPHVRYGSLFLSIMGTYCTAPPLTAWLANNSSPHVRRATSIAIGSITSNAGGILSTWLLGLLSPAPNYTKATITYIIMSVGMVILSAANLAYLSMQNRSKARKRARTRMEEEPDGLGDRSAWFIYNL